MKKYLKAFSLATGLSGVFVLYAHQAVAGDNAYDNNSYLIFVESNMGNGYHGNLISANHSSATAKDIEYIDQLCQNSKAKPEDPSGYRRSYKALITSEGYRYPFSEYNGSDNTNTAVSRDWVLQPNTEYYNVYHKRLKMTEVNATFKFPFDAAIANSDYRVWTGLNTDWSIANNACNQWMSNGSSQNGRVAKADSSHEGAISYEGKNCDKHGYLYCVMQPTTLMLEPTPGGERLADSTEPIRVEFENSYGVDASSVVPSSITLTAANGSLVSGAVNQQSDSVYGFTPSVKLIPGVKYVVAVTGVKDNSGHLIPDAKFVFTAIASQNTIFVTHGHWFGTDIGGISGADMKCQAEANQMGFEAGTFKAMLADSTRNYLLKDPWPLKANTEYFNLDSQSLGTTTNLATFDKDLTNYIKDRSGLIYKRVWTGMNADSTNSKDNCDNWEKNAYYGSYGASNSLEISKVLNSGSSYCKTDNSDGTDSKAHLYCVRTN